MVERRTLARIIVKSFRPRFMLAYLLFFCLAGAGFTGVLFGPLVVQLFDPSVPVQEQTAVATAFLALHARVWLGVALVFLVGVVHLSIVSKRVAGPLVRLNGIFHAVRRGDVSMRVRVREKDYLREDVSAIDGMMLGLRRRLSSAKGRVTRLEAAVEDLRVTVPPGSGPDVDRALQSVQQQVQLLRRRLEGFRTVPVKPDRQQTVDRGSQREQGFTLLELLLAVAIFATLTALSIPLYGEALNRAKVVRATSEIQAFALDIRGWKASNGRLPDNLLEAGIVNAIDPYGTPYHYLRIDGAEGGTGTARTYQALTAINTDFDLYSVGRDRVSRPMLNHTESLDDIVRGNDGEFVGLAGVFPAKTQGTGDALGIGAGEGQEH